MVGSSIFRFDQLTTFTGFERIRLDTATNNYAQFTLGNQPIEIDATGYLSILSNSPSNWNGSNIINGDASHTWSTTNLNFLNDAVFPRLPVTYDLTSNTFSHVTIGNVGDQVTLLINNAVTAGIQSVSGFGQTAKLATAGSTLDLSHTTVAGVPVTSTNALGTAFTVGDLGTAFQIAGGAGQDTIIASGLTFSADQRAAIFAVASIEKIVDSSGVYLKLTGNHPPIVTTSGGTAAASEQVAVAVDTGVTLVDVDNPTLVSATVAITGGFHAGQDVLAFSNNSSTMGNIAGTYLAGTGILTLTSPGATATLAQWHAALRAVAFINTSDTPDTGNRTVSFVVNDGADASTASTKMVSVAAINDAPVVTIPHPTLTPARGQTLQVADVFGATDADNDPLSYVFYDATPGGGHFVVNGVTQAANQIVSVSAAQLAQTTFVPGPGQSDDLLVGATDGFAFSGWSNLHVDGPVNHAPVVTIPHPTLTPARGQTLQVADVFGATDADNDPLSYVFYDATPGGGHFVVNGVTQAANQIVSVSAAQLAQTTFVPGPGQSDDLLVGATDGFAFSGWSNLHVDGPVNHAPVVTIPSPIVQAAAGQTLQASALFSAIDSDNDTLSYLLYDATGGNGHFSINGVTQAANQIISVSAAQLAQTTFVPALGASDDLLIGATDGHAFSGWSDLHIV